MRAINPEQTRRIAASSTWSKAINSSATADM
jgi:hypothetical protein